MNRRRRKKAEKKKRAAVHRILDAVIDVNGLGCREVCKTGNLPTAFFEFNGHVASLHVRIYKHGWKLNSYNADERRFSLYIDTCTDEDVKRFLKNMEMYLK